MSIATLEVARRIEDLLERIPISGCWIYMGGVNRQGYGKIWSATSAKERQHLFTHRAMYEHYCGPIASGLQIDHLCRVKCCCNPSHLEPVTPKENTRRYLLVKPFTPWSENRKKRFKGPWNKGKKFEYASRPGQYKLILCPHCGKEGTRGPGMYKFHFNGCAFKNESAAS